jgi:glyoxylase-like metal-dependent hydrolase (beta-lactamase superfamily II)
MIEDLLDPDRDIAIRRVAVGPLETNAYLVRPLSGSRAVLIDPGARADAIVAAAAGFDVRAILLTHTHFDHVMALPELSDTFDVPVYAHPAEHRVWRREIDHLRRHGYFDAGTATADLLAQDPTLLSPHGPLWNGTFRPIEPGQTWELDRGLGIAALHTPGHTPGGITFGVPGRLFTGDTLFPGGPGLTGWPLSNFPTIIDSVRQLLGHPPNTVIHPGHGPATTVHIERPWIDTWQARGW